MKTRIIPGAVSSTTLRALVLSEASSPPPLKLSDLRGAPCPPLTVKAHGSGDPRFDQHVISAGVYLYVAEASGLKPGTDYQLADAHIRTLPRQLPARGISLALASCYCNDFKRDRDYLRVLQGAAGYNPLSAKLLVGDNLYIDVGPGVGSERTAFESTADLYLQHYWRGGYAEVLSYLPTFTMWDDHEFWNNYPEHQIWLPRSMGQAHGLYKAAALAGIKAFQAVLNPTPASRGGLSYRFELPGLSVFALDLRAGRSMHEVSNPIMCSEAELQAFERWAGALKGPGAVIVGQPLWSSAGDWKDWNPPAFAAQYTRIWKALADAPYDIVILTGDVHHSRLLELSVGPGRRVWELVSSPVCHIPTIESIAARAFDQQDHGRVGYPLAITVPGVPLSLTAFHMGTNDNNSLALMRLVPAPDGLAIAGTFVDLVRKTPARPADPPAGSPVAPGPPSCQRDPMFVLRRRA